MNTSNRKPAGRRIRAAKRPQIAESPATRLLETAKTVFFVQAVCALPKFSKVISGLSLSLSIYLCLSLPALIPYLPLPKWRDLEPEVSTWVHANRGVLHVSVQLGAFLCIFTWFFALFNSKEIVIVLTCIRKVLW